eukprot:Ihof_evm10s195 gene=Ihof_evmTU10s195
MALVNYGSGSESSDEEQPEIKTSTSTSSPKRSTLFSTLPPPRGTQSSLFSMLPKPKNVESVTATLPSPKSLAAMDENKELGLEGKRKRQPIKISAPTLPIESDDEEEEVMKKPKLQASVKGAGLGALLSSLPAPKGKQTSLDIGSSDSKAVNKITNRPLIPHIVSKKSAVPLAKKVKDTKESDEEEGDDGSSFLLSLSAPRVQSEPLVNSDLQEEEQREVGPAPPLPSLEDDDVTAPYPEMVYQDDQVAYPLVEDYPQIPVEGPEQEAMRALEGRGHRVQSGGAAQFIEIDAKEQTGSTAYWQQNYAHMQPAKPSISQRELKEQKNMKGQGKRKHQITYLAAQAKAQQSELEQ